MLSALDGEGKTTSINVEGWIYRTQKADLSEEQKKKSIPARNMALRNHVGALNMRIQSRM